MYKLKDIISSGGTNPKINKAIDRYELSKDEKKDIINTIKNATQGGGESGGGSSLEYINFEGVTFDSEQIRLLLIKFSYGIKYNVSGQKLIVTTAMHANPTGADLYAIAIDFSFAMGEYGDIMSLKDYFAARLNFDTDNLPRITKEEFYTL